VLQYFFIFSILSFRPLIAAILSRSCKTAFQPPYCHPINLPDPIMPTHYCRGVVSQPQFAFQPPYCYPIYFPDPIMPTHYGRNFAFQPPYCHPLNLPDPVLATHYCRNIVSQRQSCLSASISLSIQVSTPNYAIQLNLLPSNRSPSIAFEPLNWLLRSGRATLYPLSKACTSQEN
jgi:hypothetical protein